MKTILVVDDEPAIVLFVCLALEEEGYRVETATNGLLGLAQARAIRPALVLTDMMMPHLTGLDLAEQLHADPDLRAIPLILMSAAQKPELSAPIAAFLNKPFELYDLLAVVERCIDTSQVRNRSGLQRSE